MTQPRLVLFDLDDTLFAHREAVDAGIVSYAQSLGGQYLATEPSAAAALWHTLEEQHYHRYLAGELGFEGQRRARATAYAAQHGEALDDDAAGAWFEDYFEHYVASWTLHPDSMPCLDALLRMFPGVHLGLITNGELDYQLRKIEQVKLGARVEHVIASGELGFTKPDPRIFRHACSLYGVAPESAVYVGDRFATDALGAANAGLTGVWIDRRDRGLSPEEQRQAAAAGVIRIHGLDELPAAIAKT
jgi:putative hydrolase of the HAD superfamily